MDRDAADGPVTLVIRAPNQRFHDQTINCFLSWTVEKLKRHIANVYPSKPLCKEQRLVYSGRLLQDHQQLRDVLRTQEEYHMVHLVCSPRTPADGSDLGSPPVTSDPSATNVETVGPSPSVTVSYQDVPGPPITGSADGLRHRGGSARPQGMPLSALAAPPAGLAAHPVYTPMQMLWWQQMYARQYYMQYQAAMAASQASAETPPPPPSPRPTAVPAPPNEPAAPMGPNPAPNPIPEERPANQNLQMNAQGGAILNEDELNRDWLDWLYTVSRAAILLSIVYFYSSFSRFVMVIGAMLLVYLHQAGWFPFRAELQNPVPAEDPQDEAERNNDIQEMERIMDEGIEEEDDAESGEEGSEDAAPPRPGFLASTWSFISTFFTSLVPEGPPRAAN
ncbi:homocysteine-responsive endoplasmic reticulum-resident ubiquitin-like domain member 2 protein isoform X1 [Astyanax mexicanus]|uniref:Homocysteine-responsive endoplasmic reticulum-resident ubiquitin-like domain member 2 protein n=1 Tax=Astyanax mexicanus TaxID=7994 RepID=A0A8T2KJQ0_ASTMX|nr:homocysteine-responsive endoplasmic reticulum-resident ubiquitin-like domain member 2 protein isoform X1 [Astyanax mexicanus]